jgi:hypothetical protein
MEAVGRRYRADKEAAKVDSKTATSSQRAIVDIDEVARVLEIVVLDD